MALARFALKNFQHRLPLVSLSSANGVGHCNRDFEFMRRFSVASDKVSASTDEKSKSGSREIAVNDQEGGRKKSSKWLPRSLRRRGGGGLWNWGNRRRGREISHFDLDYLFPSGLGDALLQASQNLNRLFENLAPGGLMGRMKEDDECYKLRYEVPGLAKKDIKITVEDGFLMIKGEHKEEEGSDDDDWSSSSYGYYNTSLLLPEDAKVDEIKAEMKDGVLSITIPRTEKPKKDVKEVQIQ